MKKEKQHIIPQAYLDAFLDCNKHLYSVKTKVSHKQTLQPKSKAAVGYAEGYYDTKKIPNYFYEKLGPDYIEKKVNAYYENSCRKLIGELTKKPKEVSLDFAQQFIELLISFKQRNPQFNNMMDKETRLRVAREKVELAAESGFYEKIKHHLNGESKESFFERANKQMEEYASDDTLPLKVQMEAVVDLREGQNGFADEVMQLLISGEWFIYESKHRIPFITSDNPGYTFDEKGRVQNLSFDSAISFQFPLTPSLFFMVMIRMEGPFVNGKKRITYGTCTPEMTRLFNMSSIPYSHSRIISNDKNEMQYMLDTYFSPNARI